jgi:predicted enzyme related to lactoylglutathione lyase
MEPRLAFTFDSVDPESLARFWSEALGYTSLGRAGEFWPLLPESDREPMIILQQVPEEKTGKNRMHLDLHVEDLDGEVARLVTLGARRLQDEPSLGHGHTWFVMADPEGNEFCVVRRPAPS